MNRAKTNPRTHEERIDALRLGIENALGLIEHVDAGAACVELRARLRTDEEAAASPVSRGAPTPAMIAAGCTGPNSHAEYNSLVATAEALADEVERLRAALTAQEGTSA